MENSVRKTLQILVGGTAGSGSLTAGAVLGRALTRMGYYVIGVNEYPSIIRGGHTSYWVRAGVEPVYEIDDTCDVVIAMDEDTFKQHANEIRKDTIIIYDPDQIKHVKINAIEYKVPLRKIIREYELAPIAMNMIALGVCGSLIGVPMDYLYKAIEDQFRARPKVIESNKKALTIGYEYASTNTFERAPRLADPNPWGERIYVTGNEAISLGMIKAGVKFYAAYPMTPASPILHYMINVSRDKDIIVVQAESEIAAAQMVLGAAWAGVRAAAGTSGGGFALMNETLSMAGMIEAPLVIILAMRAGPSTGMATMNSQEDLLYAIFAGHGEFPRLVVAPGDQYEAFFRTIEVFNLAEKYRVPAIILEDKHLAESHRSVPAFPEKTRIDRGQLLTKEDVMKKLKEGWSFKPYEITETGVSPWVIPGTPYALVKSESSEHDEYGYVTIDPEIATQMYLKRLRKAEYLRREIEEKYEPIKVYGTEIDKSDIVVVTFGSATWASLEASKYLLEHGIHTHIVQISYLAPFPIETFKKIIKPGIGKPIVTIEYNATGLLGRLVSLETGIKPVKHFGKVDGRPFRPRHLANLILQWLRR